MDELFESIFGEVITNGFYYLCWILLSIVLAIVYLCIF